MKFTTPDGQVIQSFKRLRVTSQATKNSNPTIGNILYNGASPTTYPEEWNLSISSFSAAETYQLQNTTGAISTLTEEQSVSWYVSDGALQFSSVNPESVVKFTPSEPRASELVIAAVLRDGRGGMSVQIVKVP